jgi:perosamine synthetase
VTELDERRISIAVPSLGEEEWEALREPLESGWLTAGPKVAAFERAFAARHQVARALATTSCTTGLHLALAAAGVGAGDEVVVPAFTWVATANVVLYCGASPVFVDVDPCTYNVVPEAVASALTDRTRAVVPVHLFGLCADMDAIRAAAPNRVLVEDAACAAGAAYKGRPAGGLGDAGVFSFHPRKTITTGEGGMVTTDHQEFADRAARLRNHGASVSEEMRHAGDAPYLLPDFNELGFNYRMTDLQAAVGLVQLAKLDLLVAERARGAAWYAEALGDIDWLQTPAVPDGYQHGWQSYVTLVRPDGGRDRNEVMRQLHAVGVASRPGTHAVSELGLYRERLGLTVGQFPVAAFLARQTLALPLHNRMSELDFEYVSDVLHRV